MFNLVLRSTSLTLVSLANLFTVPIAAGLAALLLGQIPPLGLLPGLALLVAGAALVISSTRPTAR